MTHDDQSLRLRARDAMQRKTLPARSPDNTWGGPGNGGMCPICQIVLASSDMVFDLEFSAETGQRGPTNIQVHARCFRAWEAERESLRSGENRATLTSSDGEPSHSGENL